MVKLCYVEKNSVIFQSSAPCTCTLCTFQGLGITPKTPSGDHASVGMTQQSQRVTSKLGMFPCYADHLGKFVICKGKTEKMITRCCVFVVKQRIKTGIFKMYCIDKLLFNPFHQPDHPVFCHQQQGLSWQENTSTLCNHLHSKTKIYSLLKQKVDAVVFALLLK